MTASICNVCYSDFFSTLLSLCHLLPMAERLSIYNLQWNDVHIMGRCVRFLQTSIAVLWSIVISCGFVSPKTAAFGFKSFYHLQQQFLCLHVLVPQILNYSSYFHFQCAMDNDFDISCILSYMWCFVSSICEHVTHIIVLLDCMALWCVQ